ncbi:WXG100 family type VII secretion target [Dactylosporangium sp. CA-139066]|uniref:WXG100 family type VII secretion target n=1 Tax=Dactylosporangium sp. CA-139066 TaxID=3239930 RepID=UPI003D8D324A
MAQTTQAQQAELNAAAQRFEQVDGELQNMLNTLMSELEITQSGWQGAGGRSFTAVKQAFHNDQVALNRNLLETAQALRTAGQNYDATDTEAASRMQRTTGIDLSALG